MGGQIRFKEPEGKVWINPKDGSEVVFIPGGDFQMGSSQERIDALLQQHPDWKREWFENEQPEHPIHVEPFYLSKYEVTNAQWKKFVDANREWRKGGTKVKELGGEGYLALWDGDSLRARTEKQPVIYVFWQAAQAYCEWAGLRLPTEAEWEYAAQGGMGYEYGTSTGGISPELANYNEVAAQYLKPVGSFPANPFGIHDLAGNVFEWCSSEYKAYPYRADDGREDLQTKVRRVVRGGAGYGPAFSTRARYRFHWAPESASIDGIGLRCAKDLRP